VEGPAGLFRDIEHGARQEEFRKALSGSGVTITTVTSPDDLRAALYQTLVKSDYSGAGDIAGRDRCSPCRRCGVMRLRGRG
jgi:arginyl-tRNA--protein-N-Asp/Glu arginylyltransferase